MKIDHRVWLVWWLIITVVVFSVKTLISFIGVIAFLMLTWVFSNQLQKLIKVTLGFLPMIIFVLILNIDRPETAVKLALQIYTLLCSSAFVLSFGNYQFTNSIRNLKTGKYKMVDSIVELLALILNQGLMFIPLTVQELKNLQELQRIRGIDTSNNVFIKARDAVRLAIPLMVRLIGRTKQIILSSEIMNLDPFVERSIFTKMTMTKKDYLMIAMFIFFASLALTFRV